ncbi:MAG TPA: M48 family metalloprotease [Gemmatimonadaceae bacterium]|nr:M48 family metalloprotease [Gemmatimonadaceae bacterium]
MQTLGLRAVRMARGLALAAALAAPLGACARNPVTGQRELALISESQEIQMGREAAQQAAQQMGLVQDAELQRYVQRVGLALAKESERPNLPWSFAVVDDPVPNAFALPGGFIFVTRGMMNLMNSEAELASVLGHEIGHVTARHSVSQLSKAQLANLGLGIGSILAPEVAQQYGQLAGAGLQLLFLKYGRDDERQADELGFKYALEKNYDVSQMAEVFVALQRLGGSSSRSATPAWLSTHPDPGERVETARRRAAALPTPQANPLVDRSEYLREIDGLVYGENPRNGFFRDGEFIHPDLRFRVSFPQGWQTQNLPQAVLGASPEGDALIQLTLVPGSDPASAARAFLSQQGVQPGQSFQQSINGVPAAGSYFQAQTEQGVLEGIVAYFTYGSNTYQLLTYTPSGRLQRYDRLFQQVVGSFRPLTDPALLNVQPAHLSVVRTDRRETIAQFAQRTNSAVSAEELALINQVPSTSTMIEAGTMLKTVRK